MSAPLVGEGPQVRTARVEPPPPLAEPERRGVDYKVTDLRRMDMVGDEPVARPLTLIVQETQDELDAEAQKRKEELAQRPVQFIKPSKKT